jgi:hypothetical protein
MTYEHGQRRGLWIGLALAVVLAYFVIARFGKWWPFSDWPPVLG